MYLNLWIEGPVRSGKTTQLISQYQAWIETGVHGDSNATCSQGARMLATQAILVFAANAGNRIDLGNQITTATAGHYPLNSTTPLGFFQDEVVLFWPLLIEQLHLKPQFPVRLRPENEQELAMQLWRQELDAGMIQIEGVPTFRLVRQALDLLQVAALSGIGLEKISEILQAGFAPDVSTSVWDCLGQLLVRWRDWCLERGLLTYGIISELYWRYLLPHPTYRQQLLRRYRAVLADDVDNYPAIARDLFEVLLEQGVFGAFTYNPQGGIRLGLGADPQYLSGLSQYCTVEHLEHPVGSCLGRRIGYPVVELLSNPALSLPDTIQSIQTSSRAQLLRRTGDTIVEAVRSGAVGPQEIAVIGPGLDAIARYTLTKILTEQGIAVNSLNDQRPLASSPMIRALLTVLALVYPGLGQLVNRDDVAEMLIVLSIQRQAHSSGTTAKIDPVRAGLLADYCFEPDLDRPRLLDATKFARWDRLGYAATTAYTVIVQWLNQQQHQQAQRLPPPAIAVLDQTIQHFLWPRNLAYDQLAALRELLETAQHYWDVEARLRQSPPTGNAVIQQQDQRSNTSSTTVAQFIRLLRSGTITANPFPSQNIGQRSPAVTLATTFQYRSVRQSHRWHFWLDTGSSLWYGGGAVVLLGAPFFLKHWSGQAWTTQMKMQADQEQLQRLLIDLLNRVEERVYLCHSDLSVSGQEQAGPLLPLVDASFPLPA